MNKPFEIPIFKRSMKLMGTLLITLSAITPASSIFIIAPGVVQQAGTGALMSFALAALVSLLTAYVYAELSSAFPLTGGEYTIVGRLLGPYCGFVTLGLNLVTLILIVAVIALGIGNYIHLFIPGLSTEQVGVLTVIFTTLCALLNIRTNALITGAFLVIEMLTLIVLTFLGFQHINRPFSEIIFHPQHLSLTGLLEPTSIGMMGMATSVAIFAYNGYGNAVYLGEETQDAPQQIARAILWSLLICILAEAVPVASVLVGARDLVALFGSDNMFSSFVEQQGSSILNKAMSLGIALAIINANIAFVVLVARLLFSTGRDHVWPSALNKALTRIHPRFQSPWIATLVCGALASFACLIDLKTLLVITGSSIVVIYATLCIAVMAGRSSHKTDHAHYHMPLYPWPPILALGSLIYVIYANYLDEDIGRPSLYATLAIIVLASVYYFFRVRRNGLWVLHTPR